MRRQVRPVAFYTPRVAGGFPSGRPVHKVLWQANCTGRRRAVLRDLEHKQFWLMARLVGGFIHMGYRQDAGRRERRMNPSRAMPSTGKIALVVDLGTWVVTGDTSGQLSRGDGWGQEGDQAGHSLRGHFGSRVCASSPVFALPPTHCNTLVTLLHEGVPPKCGPP